MDREVLRQWLPIGISLLSFCLASFSLGWNIYRDVILKARVRVRFAIVSLVSPGRSVGESERFLKIGVTNRGPGKVRIHMITGRVAPLWRRLFRRVHHFVILNDYTNPLNPQLPLMLEVGEEATLLLRYNA